MKRVLLSAFACDPSKGSEPGNGWNWASGLAGRGFEVHCFTRIIGKDSIESIQRNGNLHFHFVTLPFGAERLYKKGMIGMYLYYFLWQWYIYKKASKLNKDCKFDLAHHVTWGSIQMGSFLYKLKIPFIFGPAGGGQVAPVEFRKYFLNYWKSETRRNTVSNFMERFNPAFRKMIRSSKLIMVSNSETYNLVERNDAAKIVLTLDAALPKSFFPSTFSARCPQKETLRLLWVGRMMPRKGILLVLDVMKELKSYKGISLTVIGDGEMRGSFLERINEYDLNDQVDWKGAVSYETVRSYYESHDVFFFTSLRDSCPAQLVEAMAFGLPVVTIDLHGQGLIVNNKNGIKCPCSEPSVAIRELKKAILYLYDHPEVVRSMSIDANQFATKQTWDNKIENIVDNYYSY